MRTERSTRARGSRPAGSAIRSELEKLASEIAAADCCLQVHTPVLGKRALFERSGHWAPIRLNELAPMFRSERSGVLSGLQRVRQISLDDTHVFCRPDQVFDEVARALRSALRAQKILGLRVDYVRLSLRDESDAWLGSKDKWDSSEGQLRAAARLVLEDSGLPLVEGLGEAAFYGPKLDLQVSDGRGHEETIATVQLDFNQPERFDLRYRGPGGGEERVVMIHRGTVGSMERVVAALLEHYQGRLPLWLAPFQVAILPVLEAQDPAARRLLEELLARGARAEVLGEGRLGARVREARRRRACLVAVLGEREMAEGRVEVTDGVDGSRYELELEQLVELVAHAHARRERPSWPDKEKDRVADGA